MVEISETQQAQEVIKKEAEAAARQLLEGIADLQDSLSYQVENDPNSTKGDKEAFVYTYSSLWGFVDANPDFSTVRPKAVKNRDRKAILPSQHAGVFLQFSLKDGTILRINFYGGLRMISGMDFRDQGTPTTSHARRTELIIDQETQLHWQIDYPNGPVINSRIVFDPRQKTFKQSALEIDGESINFQPSLTKTEETFEKIKTAVFKPIEALVNLIPSSV